MPENRKYKIGISSGFVSPTNPIGSLPQKLANVITWGVNYTQVDIETTAELSKRDALVGFKHILESLKMQYGMHAEITGTVAQDSCISPVWDVCQLKINEYLDLLYDFFYTDQNGNFSRENGKYMPEYIDFHISLTHSIPPRNTRQEIEASPCSTPWGQSNWDKFFNVNPYLKKWFMLNVLRSIYEKMGGSQLLYERFKLGWIKKILENDPEIESIGSIGLDIDDEDEDTERKIEKLRNNIEKVRRSRESDEEKRKMIKILEDRIEVENKIRELKNIIKYYEDGNAAEDFDRDRRLRYNDELFDENEGLLTELYEEWMKTTKKINYTGTILGEQYAYLIIAKYLQFQYEGKRGMNPSKRDEHKIYWENFINHGIGFERFREGRNIEDLEREITPLDPRTGEPITPYVKTVEKDGTIHLHPDLVAMVAACYIIGHWETPIGDTQELYFQYTDQLKRKGILHTRTFHDLSPIDKLRILGFDPETKKNIMNIVFENPHLMEAQRPGRQRIVRAIDMEKFARTTEALFEKDRNRGKTNHLYLLLDFGWWQANGMDPVREVRSGSNQLGKFVKAIQLHYSYAPGGQMNQGGSHLTIDIGSVAHERIYEWLYVLQEKGLGDNNVPIVFERGGGQNPLDTVKTSVFAMRSAVKELQEGEKGTPFDKLPPEFYGFGNDAHSANLFSSDRQSVVMKEHAFDPIKGMLEIREFDHTFLGGHTIQKGKRPDELLKERFK